MKPAHLFLLLAFVSATVPARADIPVQLLGEYGGRSHAVALYDNRLLLGIGQHLAILDISQPNDPRLMGQTALLPDDIQNIAVSGNYAYLADIWGGLQVINIADPTHPLRVGGYATSGPAFGVAVAGHFAYVADNHYGLHVIDITDPAHPERVGGYFTNGWAADVAVAGNYAYVADSLSGLQVFNISNPANPVLLGGYDEGVTNVTVVGRYAYVSDGYSLLVFDLINPAQPIRVGAEYTGGSGSIFVVGSYAYVAAGPNWCVVDITDPAHPVRISFYCPIDLARSVVVVGSYACVAMDRVGLQMFNISNPANPVLVSGYYTCTSPGNVAIDGNYAYVTDGFTGLQVIDISHPANPVRVGGYFTGGNANGLTIAGSYAYVVDPISGLHVIDIGDPLHPVHMGGCSTSSTVAIAVTGRYAYIVGFGLDVVDIADPVNPVRIGWHDVCGYGRGIIVSGSYAYVADNFGLQIIDLTNSVHPVRVGSYDTSGNAFGVVVAGSYAYVADHAAGLQIINISDPTHPVRTGGYDTNGFAVQVAVAGNYAYVADNNMGLQIIDISNPANPARVGGYNLTESTNSVAVAGNYVYVTNIERGLVNLYLAEPPGYLVLNLSSNYGISGALTTSPLHTMSWDAPLVQGGPAVSCYYYTMDGRDPSTDSPSTTSRSSGLLFPGLGTHYFKVRSCDAAGNLGPVAVYEHKISTAADLDLNGTINLSDLLVLSSYWLQTDSPGDIAPPGGDNIINLLDFHELSKRWLPDIEPPTTPTGLATGQINSNSIALSWDPATDNVLLIGYQIYRNGGPAPLASVTATAFNDTGLTPLTNYTYEVCAADESGNVSILSIPQVVSTIAPEESFFNASTVIDTPVISSSASLELGFRIKVDKPGVIKAIRFYRGATNPSGFDVHLWSNTGSLLASAHTNGNTTGWYRVNLPAPVPIDANIPYVASYFTSNGLYARRQNFYTTGQTSGSLYAYRDGELSGNGLYAVTATPAFPTATSLAATYYVDVVFQAD